MEESRRLCGAARRAGTRLLQQGEDVLCGLHSVSAGVVVGPERPQRQVGLRREDEHEQRIAKGHVAAEEAQPDGHGDQRHRHRGQELQNQGGQERQTQSGECRGAIAVGHVGDRPGLRLGPPEDLERGQARHHVEEMAGQFLEGAHAGHRAVPGRGADESHEDRDQRQADGDQHGADPIRPGHDGDDGDGHDDGEEQLGQVAGEVAVERVDARRHERAEPPRLGSLESGRAERSDVLGEGAPQLRFGRGGRPVRRAFGAPGEHGSTGDHGEQRQQRAPQRRQRPMVEEGACDDVGDQPGLRDQQQRRDTPDDDGQDQEAAGRARVVQQPGVERTTAPFPGWTGGGMLLGRLRRCVHRAPSLVRRGHRRTRCFLTPCTQAQQGGAVARPLTNSDRSLRRVPGELAGAVEAGRW